MPFIPDEDQEAKVAKPGFVPDPQLQEPEPSLEIDDKGGEITEKLASSLKKTFDGIAEFGKGTASGTVGIAQEAAGIGNIAGDYIKGTPAVKMNAADFVGGAMQTFGKDLQSAPTDNFEKGLFDKFINYQTLGLSDSSKLGKVIETTGKALSAPTDLLIKMKPELGEVSPEQKAMGQVISDSSIYANDYYDKIRKSNRLFQTPDKQDDPIGYWSNQAGAVVPQVLMSFAPMAAAHRARMVATSAKGLINVARSEKAARLFGITMQTGAGNNYQDALDAGLSPRNALYYTAAFATLSSKTEGIAFDAILHGSASRFGQLAGKLFTKGFTKKLASPFIDRYTKSKMVRMVTNLGFSSVAEGAQEATQQVIQSYIGKMGGYYDLANLAEAVKENFLLGAFGGSVMHGLAHLPMGSKSNFEKNQKIIKDSIAKMKSNDVSDKEIKGLIKSVIVASQTELDGSDEGTKQIQEKLTNAVEGPSEGADKDVVDAHNEADIYDQQVAKILFGTGPDGKTPNGAMVPAGPMKVFFSTDGENGKITQSAVFEASTPGGEVWDTTLKAVEAYNRLEKNKGKLPLKLENMPFILQQLISGVIQTNTDMGKTDERNFADLVRFLDNLMSKNFVFVSAGDVSHPDVQIFYQNFISKGEKLNVDALATHLLTKGIHPDSLTVVGADGIDTQRDVHELIQTIKDRYNTAKKKRQEGTDDDQSDPAIDPVEPAPSAGELIDVANISHDRAYEKHQEDPAWQAFHDGYMFVRDIWKSVIADVAKKKQIREGKYAETLAGLGASFVALTNGKITFTFNNRTLSIPVNDFSSENVTNVINGKPIKKIFIPKGMLKAEVWNDNDLNSLITIMNQVNRPVVIVDGRSEAHEIVEQAKQIRSEGKVPVLWTENGISQELTRDLKFKGDHIDKTGAAASHRHGMIIWNDNAVKQSYKNYMNGFGHQIKKEWGELSYEEFRAVVHEHEMTHIEGKVDGKEFDEHYATIVALYRIGRHDVAGAMRDHIKSVAMREGKHSSEPSTINLVGVNVREDDHLWQPSDKTEKYDPDNSYVWTGESVIGINDEGKISVDLSGRHREGEFVSEFYSPEQQGQFIHVTATQAFIENVRNLREKAAHAVILQIFKTENPQIANIIQAGYDKFALSQDVNQLREFYNTLHDYFPNDSIALLITEIQNTGLQNPVFIDEWKAHRDAEQGNRIPEKKDPQIRNAKEDEFNRSAALWKSILSNMLTDMMGEGFDEKHLRGKDPRGMLEDLNNPETASQVEAVLSAMGIDREALEEMAIKIGDKWNDYLDGKTRTSDESTSMLEELIKQANEGSEMASKKIDNDLFKGIEWQKEFWEGLVDQYEELAMSTMKSRRLIKSLLGNIAWYEELAKEAELLGGTDSSGRTAQEYRGYAESERNQRDAYIKIALDRIARMKEVLKRVPVSEEFVNLSLATKGIIVGRISDNDIYDVLTNKRVVEAGDLITEKMFNELFSLAIEKIVLRVPDALSREIIQKLRDSIQRLESMIKDVDEEGNGFGDDVYNFPASGDAPTPEIKGASFQVRAWASFLNMAINKGWTWIPKTNPEDFGIWLHQERNKAMINSKPYDGVRGQVKISTQEAHGKFELSAVVAQIAGQRTQEAVLNAVMKLMGQKKVTDAVRKQAEWYLEWMSTFAQDINRHGRGNNPNAYWWSAIGEGGLHQSEEEAKAFMLYYPEVYTKLTGLEPTAKQLFEWRTHRPEGAYWNIVPWEIKNIILWVDANMVEPVKIEGQRAGIFNYANLDAHARIGYTPRFAYKSKAQEKLVKQGIEGNNTPEKQHRTEEEYRLASTAGQEIDRAIGFNIANYSDSLSHYLLDKMNSIARASMINKLGSMVNPEIPDINMVTYEKNIRDLAAKGVIVLDKDEKNFDEKVKRWLEKQGYVQAHNMPGLAEKHQGTYRVPWVHASLEKTLNSIIDDYSRNDLSAAFIKLNQIQKVLVMFFPAQFAWAIYQGVAMGPNIKMTDRISLFVRVLTGSLPFTAASGGWFFGAALGLGGGLLGGSGLGLLAGIAFGVVAGAMTPGVIRSSWDRLAGVAKPYDMYKNMGIDQKIIKRALLNNVQMVGLRSAFAVIYDRYSGFQKSKIPGMTPLGTRVAEWVSGKFGMDDYAFQDLIPKLILTYYGGLSDKLISDLVKQGMDPAEAEKTGARVAAQIVNRTAGSLASFSMYASEADIIRVFAFATDYTLSEFSIAYLGAVGMKDIIVDVLNEAGILSDKQVAVLRREKKQPLSLAGRFMAPIVGSEMSAADRKLVAKQALMFTGKSLFNAMLFKIIIQFILSGGDDEERLRFNLKEAVVGNSAGNFFDIRLPRRDEDGKDVYLSMVLFKEAKNYVQAFGSYAGVSSLWQVPGRLMENTADYLWNKASFSSKMAGALYETFKPAGSDNTLTNDPNPTGTVLEKSLPNFVKPNQYGGPAGAMFIQSLGGMVSSDRTTRLRNEKLYRENLAKKKLLDKQDKKVNWEFNKKRTLADKEDYARKAGMKYKRVVEARLNVQQPEVQANKTVGRQIRKAEARGEAPWWQS